MRVFIDPAFRNILRHDQVIADDTFPDGEQHVTVPNVQGESIVVVVNLATDADITRWLLTLTGLVQRNPQWIHLIIPFFPYSTMEKAKNDDDVATAQLIARMIENALHGCEYTISLCEIHNPVIKSFFQSDRVYDVALFPLYVEMVQRYLEVNDIPLNRLAFASVDGSRGRVLNILRTHFGVETPVAVIQKQRESAYSTKVESWDGDVRDKHVLIFDDMLRTGGSADRAATLYIHAGHARSVSIIATHNRMCNMCSVKVGASFRYAALTDTIPRVQLPDCINQVHSIAPVLEAHIKKLKELA